MQVTFNKPFIVGGELENLATAVMRNLSTAGNGEFTKLCHKWLENNLGCAKALLTHSCTGALEMAAILCDIRQGDEVIMPSFTFVSTAVAFVLRQGTPVFVDISERDLNIDPNLIEAAITDKTKAIVPVHYAGVGCDMDAINEIAAKHGLYVIEDAAQAMLSEYKGRALGTLGDLGCLSFHETKNIISGEGGALLINDEALIERAEIIWQKGTNRKKFEAGQVDKYTWVDIGSSFLPSDIVAAFLYAQMQKAQEINSRRKAICARYASLLAPLKDEGLIEYRDSAAGNGHIFYVLTRSADERAALLEYLNNHGVNAIFHYVPLHNSPAGLKYGRSNGELNVTCDVSRRLLRLPLFFEMREEEIEYVVKTLCDYFK